MKKLILVSGLIIAFTIACNNPAKHTTPDTAKKELTDTALKTQLPGIETLTYKSISLPGKDTVYETIILQKNVHEKSGTFEIIQSGKTIRDPYKGTFKEVANKKYGTIYILQGSAELPDYYKLENNKLINISTEMINPDGN